MKTKKNINHINDGLLPFISKIPHRIYLHEQEKPSYYDFQLPLFLKI